MEAPKNQRKIKRAREVEIRMTALSPQPSLWLRTPASTRKLEHTITTKRIINGSPSRTTNSNWKQF